MRTLSFFAVALTVGALPAQTTNLFEIHSGCSNYMSRNVGPNAGDMLLQVPAAHFAGVAQAPSGTASNVAGFFYYTQDQNPVTPSTYSMVLRADVGGRPNCTAGGLLLSAGPLTLPPSTSTTPIAWVIATMLNTPSTVAPTCATFYLGASVAAAANWPTDGQSFQIGTYFLLGASQADNPAPTAPNLSFECVNGMASQSGSFRCLRIGLLTAAPVLNLGNYDPTLANAANCVTSRGGVSFGAGGLFPHAQGLAGPRNDGLNFRVRDVANANGVTALFLDVAANCPGLPLAGTATGALFLPPTSLLFVTAAPLDSAGLATGALWPPNFLNATLRNRVLSVQAFDAGPTLALPGTLSNRAGATFL